MVEEELDLPLENGYTLFEEVHDSITLEPAYEEFFEFLREVHVPTPIEPSHNENVSLYNPLVSWFFFLHPKLPYFVAFILMKYG